MQKYQDLRMKISSTMAWPYGIEMGDWAGGQICAADGLVFAKHGMEGVYVGWLSCIGCALGGQVAGII